MEIRQIKKAKPQPSSDEASVDQPTEAIKPQQPPEEKKPQKTDEFVKPRKYDNGDKPRKPYNKEKIQKFQHVKILDCNQPASRVICECWHCQQGLLVQAEVSPPEFQEVECPSCGKTAIRLMSGKVLSTVPIPSPWS
jgi:hypothetical protein